MTTVKKLLLLFSSLFLLSCGNGGYRKQNGQWVWVAYDGSFNKIVTYMEYTDRKSFKVLPQKNYAKNKEKVFFCGRPVKNADPATFEVIDNKYGYAKDRYRAYLDQETIISADPASFELLEFPYSRDENQVFCGVLPLGLSPDEVREFKVTNTDKLMAGMKSTMLLSVFIEQNPEYAWLDTLGISHVVFGAWGTGETKSRRIKGYKEVK